MTQNMYNGRYVTWFAEFISTESSLFVSSKAGYLDLFLDPSVFVKLNQNVDKYCDGTAVHLEADSIF